MTETQSTDTIHTTAVLPSITTRKNFVIATILFTWAVIIYVLLQGKPDNSLHTSALAWAFMTNVGVIGAFIFGVSWDNSVIIQGARR
jgi:ABC-type antimicrobial peptide transport system permease subunit